MSPPLVTIGKALVTDVGLEQSEVGLEAGVLIMRSIRLSAQDLRNEERAQPSSANA